MGIRAGHVSGIGMGFSQMVIFLALALCFWAGAKLVDAGEISFEEMMNVSWDQNWYGCGIVA